MVYKVPVYVYKGPEIMVYVLPFFLGFLFFPHITREKKNPTPTLSGLDTDTNFVYF